MPHYGTRFREYLALDQICPLHYVFCRLYPAHAFCELYSSCVGEVERAFPFDLEWAKAGRQGKIHT